MKSQAGVYQGGTWFSRTETFEALRRSFSLHVRRPLILATVILGSLLQFGVAYWLGRRSPTPADLAGMFAPPPIDSFTWSPSVFGIKPLALLLLIRLAVISTFICLVLGMGPKRLNILRTTGAYLASVVSFGFLSALLAALGPLAGSWVAGFLGSGGDDPLLAGARLALGMVFFLLFVPLLVLFTVIVSPFIAKCAAGQGLKPRLAEGSLWILAAASALLYIAAALGGHGPAELSPGSFARAFVVLSLQSLIFAAIVSASAGTAALRTLGE